MWLIVALTAYLLFAVNNLIDKHLLAGPIKPKIYIFYVGILSILVLILIPFVNFSFPNPPIIFLSFLTGAIFILGLWAFYTSLKKFEASRVIPAIGGLLPIFTFTIIYLFSESEKMLSLWEILAFILLILGSIFSTLKRKKSITIDSLKISALTAFLFAVAVVLTKYIYLVHDFWSSFILMKIGGVLCALILFVFPQVRKGIFTKKFALPKGKGILFLGNQAIGACANILQNLAIDLVPLGMLAFINAVEGSKYVFLLIIAFFVSFKFPKFLREEISRSAILQKTISVVLIIIGIIILAFQHTL